jgi:transcription initiation factor TFIIIB Brf1 subunit/transcription initiation factor TFIIB
VKVTIKSLTQGATQQKLNDTLDQSYIIVLKIISNRRLPLDVFGTSMTIFHYYTYYKSFRDFDKAQLAVASIFLGCKLHSIFLNIDDALRDYRELTGAGKIFDIVKFEVEMLNLLGFDLDIVCPYGYIITYAKRMGLQDTERIISVAFNIANDSYRRPFCVYFSPRQIALACLYIAINMFNFIRVDALPDVERFSKCEIIKCVDLILVMFEGGLKLST